MKILVMGAKGFVGRNLCAQVKNILDGEARNYKMSPRASLGRNDNELSIDEVFEYDIDSTPAALHPWCAEAAFAFNLAGVNRPTDTAESMARNFGFASTLLDTLRAPGNTCPVMLSSSQQESLAGRFGHSESGRSKKAGAELFLDYGLVTGAAVSKS